MDIRHLRYFIALWEARSFTAAASKVHITQSTLSHQIRQLEDEVAQPLFVRTEHGVLGTPAGEIFHAHAVETLQAFDRGIAAMRAIPRKLVGQVRLGVTPTVNIDLVPRAVATFVKQHPAVQVTVAENSSREIAQLVQKGRLDVGIGYAPPIKGATLRFEPLFDDELVLVVSRDHRLADRRRIRMSDLHHMELVLQPKTCTTRHILEVAFAAAKAVPAVVVEMESLPAIKSLVRRTMLAGILSRLAVRDSEDLVAIPIEGPTPLRVPGFITRQGDPSFTLASFCAIVTSVVSEGKRPRARTKRDSGSRKVPAA